MNALDTWVHAVTSGALDIAAAYDHDTLVGAGMNPERVRELGRVHHAYFGPTRCTAMQRDGVVLARSSTLDKLIYIENRLRGIKGDTTQWELRLQLLAVPGTYAALKAAANTIIPPDNPTPPTRGVRFSKTVLGMRTAMITGPERFMADLEHRLGLDIDPESDTPAATQKYDAFTALCTGDTGGVQAAVPRPNVIISLADHINAVNGEGSETILHLTDGTTMTGADYIEHLAHVTGLDITLVHPYDGPLNLYRAERCASEKQRKVACTMSTTCAWEGCRVGAEYCQMHHIISWEAGGETNIVNIIPLCKYHNMVNNDRRLEGKRGYVVYTNWIPTWVSPRGHHITATSPGAWQLLHGASTVSRS